MLAAGRIRLVLSRATVSNLNRNGAKMVGVGPIRIPVATMLATHGDPYPYDPNPWPYESRTFTPLHHLIDWTSERLNENSKVITVEGNFGVGKQKFAERIANEFDLKVFPAVSHEDVFQLGDHTNNFDLRTLDFMLPEGAQCYTLEKFLNDPNPESGQVGRLLRHWLNKKCTQYAKALNHLLSTGQGVVVVKSPFSDDVYLEALRRMGWITKNYQKYHMMLRDAACVELMTPHLTFYLDAPVSTLRDRINKRNRPWEKNGRNMTDKYLQTVDQVFKEKHLPTMRRSGEVLEIDWETEADNLDMDAIAEEVSLLKLEGEDNEDPRFIRWTQLDEEEMCALRTYYGSPAHLARDTFRRAMVPYDCDELHMTPEEVIEFNRVVKEHPSIKYTQGWAPELGDEVRWRI